MKIPPVIGLLISLCVGILLGGFSMYQYMDKKQVQADVSQIKKDTKKAAVIDAVTVKAKKENTVSKTITKWRNRPPVIIQQELTNDEINILCNNHFAPDDIVQSLRSEATKARRRFNNMSNDTVP